ncbi:Uncharacterised protein [Mycolicibacterium aurum]|uniref:Uncharacterized protein n=1 Tax=Mycolicibacterium aurum TaxID=1791 RepID=A0A448IYZ3_MYCAU|nr:hypothetical protein [Mycolicibacterium aurum]VEG57601.1 Uncharacterised protein [Mycolicibacterium aurum]
MAFKLTYSDGQESQHDDDTVWELDDGVLKLGREKGKWSVLLSPSHWAVLELGGQSRDGDDSDDDSKDSKDKESKDKDSKAQDDTDDSDDEKSGEKDSKDESDKDS